MQKANRQTSSDGKVTLAPTIQSILDSIMERIVLVASSPTFEKKFWKNAEMPSPVSCPARPPVKVEPKDVKEEPMDPTDEQPQMGNGNPSMEEKYLPMAEDSIKWTR